MFSLVCVVSVVSALLSFLTLVYVSRLLRQPLAIQRLLVRQAHSHSNRLAALEQTIPQLALSTTTDLRHQTILHELARLADIIASAPPAPHRPATPSPSNSSTPPATAPGTGFGDDPLDALIMLDDQCANAGQTRDRAFSLLSVQARSGSAHLPRFTMGFTLQHADGPLHYTTGEHGSTKACKGQLARDLSTLADNY